MADRILVLGADPGHIRIELAGLPLGQRNPRAEAYTRLVDLIYRIMPSPQAEIATLLEAEHPRPLTGPLMPPKPARPYQTLPHVAISDVTGLIELVHASGDRADLYQLGRDLQLEVDELLPLVDAADLLELADQSNIISAILAEWGDYSPLVEPEIFGTTDPAQIARHITAFCSTELGSAIAGCLFYHVSQGGVCGLCLENGRQIVIKVHPPKQSSEFLTAVYRVQRHLADHGFPCPEPILGPISLLNGHATVEELQDAGIYADAHDPAIRRTMAETLYWLVDLTRDFVDVPGLPAGILSQKPGGALWPQPHSKIFDFEATKAPLNNFNPSAAHPKCAGASPPGASSPNRPNAQERCFPATMSPQLLRTMRLSLHLEPCPCPTCYLRERHRKVHRSCDAVE